MNPCSCASLCPSQDHENCTEVLGNTSNEASCTGLGAAAGASIGLLIGAAVGALAKTDRWDEVPLNRVGVSFGRDGRFGFSAAVRF